MIFAREIRILRLQLSPDEQILLEVPFFWDATLRHWVPIARRLEVTQLPHLQGVEMYNINLCWAYLPLKMKTLLCVETSGSDHPVTQRRIPEERLQKYSCENFKPSKSGLVSLFLIPKRKKRIVSHLQ